MSTQSRDSCHSTNMDNETLEILGPDAAIEDDSYSELIEGWLIPVISMLGLVGNSLSIMVLQSSVLDMKVRISEKETR